MARRRSTKLNPSQMARRIEIGSQRRARSRAKLMEAAYRLFATHGSDAPTVDDVVEEAGVARGTFYNHFETRDELFRAVADEIAKEINGIVGQNLARVVDPATHIGLSFRMFLHYATMDDARGWILLRTMPLVGALNSEMRTLVRADFENALNSGRLHAVSVDFAFDLGIGLMIATIRRLLTERGGDRYIEQSAEGLLIALGLPAEEARMIARSPIVFEDPKRTPQDEAPVEG